MGSRSIPWTGANCSTTVAGNPSYYIEDLLGTSRVVTTNTGVVCYDADFYPFGGERTPYTSNCPATNNYKFEGKERDAETGNDDFGARYYSNRFGRWLSADWSSVPVPVPYANLTSPQTLNLYAMVSDDPESFADLDGHLMAQTYQVANPAASSAWDPGGTVDSMTNDSGLTDEEVNSLNAVRAAQAVQQPQNQVTILGNTVVVTYANGISDKDRQSAFAAISSAAGLLNSNGDKLTDAEKKSIGNIKTIDVDPTASRSSVDVKTGIFHANAGQLGQDTARFATDIAHDSFHITQSKSGVAYTGGPAERNATYFQIGVGSKIGLSKDQINFLKNYADNIDKYKNYYNSPVTHP